MNSTADRERNLATAGSLVRAAAADGAELLLLPEKWPLLATGEELTSGAEPLTGRAITAAREWARELGVTLVAGSLTAEVTPPDGTERDTEGQGQTGGESATATMPANLSAVITPEGEVTATYEKLHMFDVDVGGVSYRESRFERAGRELVTTDVPRAGAEPVRVGLTICYDLRFPELFRALLDRGTDVFTVPAAFTAATGRDHWEPLLRARAIENQSFVLAANQIGRAAPSFDSWGHSMIVDPWGDVLARVEEGEGFAAADLDFARRDEIRASLPALEHRRPGIFGGETDGA